MLAELTTTNRRIIIIALVIWALGSVWSFVTMRPDFFASMGSFSLSISFAVFLFDRYATQEKRRRWDSQILTQSRMIWRYFQNFEQGTALKDPTPKNKLRDQITGNFDDLLAAKAAERKLEHYRHELFLTIAATLQWGFGSMFVKLIYGLG